MELRAEQDEVVGRQLEGKASVVMRTTLRVNVPGTPSCD